MGCSCKNSPSLPQMAANIVQAAGRMVIAATQGESVFVPPEVAKERLSHCLKPCEHMKPINGGKAHRCMHNDCGCGLDGLLVIYNNKLLCKTCVATEECPIGCWGEYQP